MQHLITNDLIICRRLYNMYIIVACNFISVNLNIS